MTFNQLPKQTQYVWAKSLADVLKTTPAITLQRLQAVNPKVVVYAQDTASAWASEGEKNRFFMSFQEN